MGFQNVIAPVIMWGNKKRKGKDREKKDGMEVREQVVGRFGRGKYCKINKRGEGNRARLGLVLHGLGWCWRKTKGVRQSEKHNDFNL